MKQRIQLTGKNIDDLFRLPCVFQIQKSFVMGKQGNAIPNQNIEDCVIAVVQKPQSDSFFKWAKMGDWLVEDDNGGWHVEEGGEK